MISVYLRGEIGKHSVVLGSLCSEDMAEIEALNPDRGKKKRVKKDKLFKEGSANENPPKKESDVVIEVEVKEEDETETKLDIPSEKDPKEMSHIAPSPNLVKKVTAKDKLSQVLLVTGGYFPNNCLSSTQVIVWGSKML